MDLVNCPECQHHVSSRAVACPQCGFPLSLSPTASVEATEVSAVLARSRLYEIAYRQKWLLYALLLYLFSQFPIVLSMASQWSGILVLALIIGNLVLQLWCVYKLGRAVEMSLPLLCLCLAGLFMPCIAWISLLVVNAHANRALQGAGIQLGLMGASLADVP